MSNTSSECMNCGFLRKVFKSFVANNSRLEGRGQEQAHQVMPIKFKDALLKACRDGM